MAQGTLVNGETLNGSFTLTKQSGSMLRLPLANKYVGKLIELTLNAQSASPAFDGGAITDKAATATFTNMTTSSTNTSGVAIQANGAAGRAAVLYDGDVNGWVSKADNAQAVVAASTESWTGTTYYATGVTLTAGKAFDVTVPNGNSTVTFHFAVDANGNVTITGGE